MSRLFIGAVLVVCTALLATIPVSAWAMSRQEREQIFVEELQKTCPEAVDAYVRGLAAIRAHDADLADSHLTVVTRQAPKFSHAYSGRAIAYVARGWTTGGLRLARSACRLDVCAENYRVLTEALLFLADSVSLTQSQTIELRATVDQLLKMPDTDYDATGSICRAAVELEDWELLSLGVGNLRAIAPDSVGTYYYQWFLRMTKGDLDGAAEVAAQGELHGVPNSLTSGMRAKIALVRAEVESSRPWYQRALKPLLWVLLIWIGGLLVLYGFGEGLSKATLRAARAPPASASGRVSGLSSAVRKAYRAVLWLNCAYFYISIPILLILVLVLGGGTLYAFLRGGHVPIRLNLITAAIVVITVWATIKSLLIRIRRGSPGILLSATDHLRLGAVLQEVADRIGTRAVDSVYLTPGTDFAVMERGGMWQQLRESSERCMILGIGVLEGMRLDAFRAVLAHEYGHFSNRDTAGGGFALAVRRSTVAMAVGLARGGAATWYNPAWLFVKSFHRIFMRVSQGASRLQEILADRWTASSYGADAFERGLRHVIERSIRFDRQVDRKLKDVVENKKPLLNIYGHGNGERENEEEIAELLKSVMEAEPSPYDSHPRPADRIAWVHALDTSGAEQSRDDGEAWKLFSSREAVEVMMTEQIRVSIEVKHGISIPREEAV